MSLTGFNMEKKNYQGKEVRLCEDGKYRWVYEMNMFRNPTILFTVAKVLGGVILGMWLLGLIIMLFEGDWDAMLGMTKVLGIVMGVMAVLTILGYLVVCWMYHGKYIVLFEMDEKGIKHIQLPRQFKRAQAMGLITALVGLAAKRPTTAGAGLLAATKQASTSEFQHVKKVKAYPRRHLIKVNETLNKNQVYAEPEDFDFVLDWIRTRCPKLK